jgi:hypothetical protein
MTHRGCTSPAHQVARTAMQQPIECTRVPACKGTVVCTAPTRMVASGFVCVMRLAKRYLRLSTSVSPTKVTKPPPLSPDSLHTRNGTPPHSVLRKCGVVDTYPHSRAHAPHSHAQDSPLEKRTCRWLADLCWTFLALHFGACAVDFRAND